ncbi:MAG: DNA-binding protein [Campylobacteraceae bacterium]|nr:DNA-binding protein [Campylobacteraceae bacterium]
MRVSNAELFMQLYERIRMGASIDEICKDFGGGNMYIPSFKSMGRDKEIIKEYEKRIRGGKTKNKVVREIAGEYNLSIAHTYRIVNAKTQPALF